MGQWGNREVRVQRQLGTPPPAWGAQQAQGDEPCCKQLQALQLARWRPSVVKSAHQELPGALQAGGIVGEYALEGPGGQVLGAQLAQDRLREARDHRDVHGQPPGGCAAGLRHTSAATARAWWA